MVSGVSLSIYLVSKYIVGLRLAPFFWRHPALIYNHFRFAREETELYSSLCIDSSSAFSTNHFLLHFENDGLNSSLNVHPPKHIECVILHFHDSSIVLSKQVNGTVTLAENIADNGGIREAINGYRIYAARNPPEPSLPGMQQYTHEQLLFLAFANVSWTRHREH